MIGDLSPPGCHTMLIVKYLPSFLRHYNSSNLFVPIHQVTRLYFPRPKSEEHCRENFKFCVN